MLTLNSKWPYLKVSALFLPTGSWCRFIRKSHSASLKNCLIQESRNIQKLDHNTHNYTILLVVSIVYKISEKAFSKATNIDFYFGSSSNSIPYGSCFNI